MPFIIAVPRSGTTLLRLMLDSHPLLSIPPETQFLTALHKIQAPTVSQAFHAITHSVRWPDFQMSEHDLYLSKPSNAVNAIRSFYSTYAKMHGKTRWGDKTPQYGRILAPIKALLPEAFFIHLIRDGRDVCVSWRQTNYPRSISIEKHAKMWSGYIKSVREQALFVPGYLELRYEDLVSAPEKWLRQICSSIRLPYDPVMLNYFSSADDRMNELQTLTLKDGTILQREKRLSWHTKLGEGPTSASIGRWRFELSPHDANFYNGIAGSLLEELGYLR